MGPSFEQIVKESILPNDFDNLFKLSNEEMKCLINNRRVVNLLFKNMDRELSDLIHKEDKLKQTWFDAHHLWKLIESICEEDGDNEDQEEEESLEECATSETCIHPLETPHKDRGAESTKSAGSQVEPVRPVCPGTSADWARSALEGDQDKRNLHLDQHLQVKLITSAWWPKARKWSRKMKTKKLKQSKL